MNRELSTIGRLLLGVTILCLSFTTSAASDQSLVTRYNFAEFNIAFILGLSLPLVVVFALLKPIISFPLRYPILISTSLLAQFAAINYFTHWQVPLLLVAGAIFITSICLWTLFNTKDTPLTSKMALFVKTMLTSFCAAVVFVQSFDLFPVWLGYLALITVIATYASKSSELAFPRVIALWSSVVAYGVVLYFWLNVEIGLSWLISLAVVSFALAMVNGCWELSHQIFKKIEQLKQQNSQTITPDISNVTLDPTTNLPTYQQVLHRLNELDTVNDSKQFAAIAFKPLNFNQVNKVLGHQNSDILLLQLAYNIQKSISDNELLISFLGSKECIKVSRLQGLDFIVVLDGKKSNHPIKIIIEQICFQLSDSVPKAMSFKSFSLNFELAFGVAIASDKVKNSEQLIAQASDALLEAERSNQHLCYFDHKTELYTEQQLAKMEKLKQDVSNGSLIWQAHPQVSLNDKTIKGFELAIDWRCSDGTKLTSKEFEQIAEYSGEIYRLTRQLIEQAFALLSVMHKSGVEQNVAINLSSKDLLETELADYIEKQSNKANIKMSYLTIELSENVLLSSAYRARMMVDQLKALGVKIAIDEFSGSYESLKYLRRTSVQQVKIECSQLNVDDNTKSEKTIVNALINLIRKMNIPVVGIGVDNRAIEKVYLAMGGDVAQGHLLHQGIDLQEVLPWITAWKNKTSHTTISK